MADTNTVQVKISADAGEFRKGATEARTHVDGLLSRLREFRSEEVQQGRMARFLSQGLGEIGVASKGAAAEIGKLGSAFAFGGGLGLAIQILKTMGHAFLEVGEAEKTASEEFKKFVAESIASSEALRDSVNKTLMVMSGADQAELLFQSQILPKLRERSDLEMKAMAASRALAEAREKARFATESPAELEAAIQGPAQAYVRSLEMVRQKQREIDSGMEEVRRLKGAVTVQTAREQSAQQAKDLADWRAFQTSEWKKYYDTKTADAGKALKEEFDAQDEFALDMAKFRAEQFGEDKKHYDKVTAETLKTMEDIDRKQKESIHTWSATITSAISAPIHAIMDGTKDVGEALGDMVKSIIEAGVMALIQLAVQSVITAAIGKKAAVAEATSSTLGHTAAAVAGAAESQAFIPFAGPALATAAATEMLATLSAMTAPLLGIASAAGGYDIPMGVNPIVQAHQGEMILPKEHADTIRRLDRGGGGGTSIVINASALDRRWWDANKTHIVRTIRDATREGRFD